MENEKDVFSCKRFSGYKPCFPDHNCWKDGCKEYILVGIKILIINLDAMGDVLMTTAQLPALKRKFPESTIYWITLKNAAPLLFNNPLIDHVFTFDASSIMIAQQMKFDYVMNVDKSQQSCALLNSIDSAIKLGFGLDQNGKIIPINKGAQYNFNLGMDDNLKFKVNKRTGQDYLAETFELEYERDEYVFEFTDDEKKFIETYKKEIGIRKSDKVVGFNTGCSELYPNKKMTIQQHIYIIRKLLKKNYKIVLLGGPEDTQRNKEIYSKFKGRIINTPSNEGLRRGICYESIPNIIVTGDSLGMHIAIALRKFVLAWFGVSCWNEIDLYDRGLKLYNEDLFCSPCWKKQCPYDLECIKLIDLEAIISAIDVFFGKKNSSRVTSAKK